MMTKVHEWAPSCESASGKPLQQASPFLLCRCLCETKVGEEVVRLVGVVREC